MPKRMTKKELSEWLNNFLGLEISWEKLSHGELLQLYNFFNNPKKLLRKLLMNKLKEGLSLEGEFRDIVKIVEKKRPFRKVIRSLLTDQLAEFISEILSEEDLQ